VVHNKIILHIYIFFF